jgi:proline iminopeptidase
MMVWVGDVRLFVDIDGVKLVRDGDSLRERPTVVMLHGNGGDHSIFKDTYAQFPEFAQVVNYDHRGNGRSEDGSPERWTIDQWSDDLHTLCGALGIERPVVLGVSFGGLIALSYAIRHPAHPAKLVLVSVSARINPESSIRMYERLGGPEARDAAERWYGSPADGVEEFLRVCGPYFNPQPRRPELMARAVSRRPATDHFLRHEYLQHDLRSHLGQIQCPTLLLGGELDPIVPIEEMEDLAGRLGSKQVRLERFPEAGHTLGGDRDTEIRLIREFVLDEVR